VAALRDYLARHPDVAAVAPLIRTEQGRIAYASSAVDLAHAAVFLTMTNIDEWPHGPVEAVRLPWLSGAFWLFRRAAIENVGGFDERFFLLCEEVDWCLRARARGWELALLRDAEVHHSEGASFDRSSKSAYYYARNTFLLCRKHADGSRWLLSWGRIVLRPFFRPRLWRSAVPLNGIWAIVDAVRGRYGPRPLRP
jgi:GT2 family glycosyltransferase